MHFSSKQEQLRQLLNAQYAALQQTFPSNRHDALLTLVCANNTHYLETRQNSHTGLQKALSLCFSTGNSSRDIPTEMLDTWANSTLQVCARLHDVERLLDYCDSGFLHMQQGNNADYNLWVASKRIPTEWREHEDLEKWTNLLKQTYATDWDTLYAEKTHIQQQLATFVQNEQVSSLYKTTCIIDDYYYRLGALHVKCLPASTTYPPTTSIGGCTFAVYRDVLGLLIGLTLKHMDICDLSKESGYDACRDRCITSSTDTNRPKGRDTSVPTGIYTFLQHDVLLIEALAEMLMLDHSTVGLALDAFTLDAENVSYHTSTTDVPTPPLIRLDEQRCIVSLEGLLTSSLFFLMRELKRKYSFEYHTASQLREEVFRQDVYALFADKRFVKSAGHVELRGAKGTLTTDVDALIFDRKTGALALFELKSQDPFAYSPQERIRQRDYFYGASKQVIASSEWVKRNGANALLSRLDSTQVKRLKAQNVYIFVLGRYLAHFFDGPPFDTRAAWGTWSQVLRLTQGKPFGANDTNPIQSLHNKLTKDTPLVLGNEPLEKRVIEIEGKHIRMYPSFEAYRSSRNE